MKNHKQEPIDTCNFEDKPEPIPVSTPLVTTCSLGKVNVDHGEYIRVVAGMEQRHRISDRVIISLNEQAVYYKNLNQTLEDNHKVVNAALKAEKELTKKLQETVSRYVAECNELNKTLRSAQKSISYWKSIANKRKAA